MKIFIQMKCPVLYGVQCVRYSIS